MIRIDRKAINKIVEDDTMTNVKMITLLSIIGMSKYQDVEYKDFDNKEKTYKIKQLCIKKFNIHKLITYMKDNMSFINPSSIYNALDELIVRDLLLTSHKAMYELSESYCYIESDPCCIDKDTLIIQFTGHGHQQDSKGYITLHKFLFSEAFYNISLRAKKITLLALSRIDNSPFKDIKMNFKSKSNESTYKYYCEILKVNRLAKIKNSIYELRQFFNVTELDHNTFNISLNKISEKLISVKDKFFDFTEKEFTKVKEIFNNFKDKAVEFKTNQLEDITTAIKDYPIQLQRKACKELLGVDISTVDTIYGYSRAIINRLARS